MATFPDLSGYDHYAAQAITGDPLVLPIRGRNYIFDPNKLTTGAYLTLQRIQTQSLEVARRLDAGEPVDPNAVVLTDADEQRFGVELLGQDVLDQLAADGVLWTETQHVMATVMAYYLAGEKAALAVWSGERSKPADPPARAGSTKTAGSSTTRRTAKPRSAGQKSSPTGRSSKRTSNASTKRT